MDSSIIKKSFDLDGYVLIPEFLNRGEIEVLRSALKLIIKEQVPGMSIRQAFYEDSQDSSSLKQIQNLHLFDSYFHNMLFGSRFQQLAEILLSESVVGRNLQYFNKPAQIGKATPPHQDGYYFKLEPPVAATIWVALEDADEVNGCVRYIPGSHRRGLRPHLFSNVLGFSQGISDYNQKDLDAEVKVPAKAGDLLVHHAMTIHRASGNKSMNRSREALGLVYYGLSAVENVVEKETYLRDLEKNF